MLNKSSNAEVTSSFVVTAAFGAGVIGSSSSQGSVSTTGFDSVVPPKSCDTVGFGFG